LIHRDSGKNSWAARVEILYSTQDGCQTLEDDTVTHHPS
uniref:Uncharacterized protein n=1 Tax=Lates calcarifer TaxID=8187 RepID=A0A4W6DU57_LATCA